MGMVDWAQLIGGEPAGLSVSQVSRMSARDSLYIMSLLPSESYCLKTHFNEVLLQLLNID
jgi:hypothetical protein